MRRGGAPIAAGVLPPTSQHHVVSHYQGWRAWLLMALGLLVGANLLRAAQYVEYRRPFVPPPTPTPAPTLPPLTQEQLEIVELIKVTLERINGYLEEWFPTDGPGEIIPAFGETGPYSKAMQGLDAINSDSSLDSEDDLRRIVKPRLVYVRVHLERLNNSIHQFSNEHVGLFKTTIKELDSTLASVEESPKRDCTAKKTKENPHNIVICAYGSFRVNSFTVPRFRRFVYNHLARPDLFLYVKPLDEPKMIPLQNNFLKMVKRSVVMEDANYTQIRERGGYSPCLDSAEEKDRNWNAGWPTSLNPEGSGVHQLRGAEQCGEIIKEEEKRRGRKYDWVILTRTDHTYLGPHPSMEELPRDKVSIPYGEDWHGINDRHSVFPRDMVEPRFQIHNDLMTGKYDCNFRHRYWLLNGEVFMNLFYESHRIPIHRYIPRTFLGCCEVKHLGNRDPAYCQRYGSEVELAMTQEGKLHWLWAIQEFDRAVHNAREYCL